MEVNESVKSIMKEYENIKTDHPCLKKDQIELSEMWNMAIFIKKSVGGIRRLDMAEEGVWTIDMRNYRESSTQKHRYEIWETG